MKARMNPAEMSIRPQRPRSSGIAPISSSVARGSRRRNEGRVKTRVKTDDASKGKMRSRNKRLAARRGESDQVPGARDDQMRETAKERATYSTTKTANDTLRQRAANRRACISGSPGNSHPGADRGVCARPAAAVRRATRHRAG